MLLNIIPLRGHLVFSCELITYIISLRVFSHNKELYSMIAYRIDLLFRHVFNTLSMAVINLMFPTQLSILSIKLYGYYNNFGINFTFNQKHGSFIKLSCNDTNSFSEMIIIS